MGVAELLILLAILLLVFGAKRLPQLGKSLGSGIRDFRKGIADAGDDDDAAAESQDHGSEQGEELSPGEAAPEAVPSAEGEENTRIGKKR